MRYKNLTVEKLLERYPGAILIKDWKELHTKIPQESDTHIIELKIQDNGEIRSGWITAKDNDSEGRKSHYLSTHTFYGNNYRESTKLLQKCGFNVVIDNWDKERKEK